MGTVFTCRSKKLEQVADEQKKKLEGSLEMVDAEAAALLEDERQLVAIIQTSNNLENCTRAVTHLIRVRRYLERFRDLRTKVNAVKTQMEAIASGKLIHCDSPAFVYPDFVEPDAVMINRVLKEVRKGEDEKIVNA